MSQLKKFDLGKGRIVEVEVLESRVTPICVGTYEEVSLVRDAEGKVGYIKQIIDDVDHDEPARYTEHIDDPATCLKMSTEIEAIRRIR